MKRFLLVLLILLLISSLPAASFNFSKIKNRIHEFTLENGLKFILLEDHMAPIAAFVIHANVGGTDERIGIWGISHFLEHLAFKGTSEIGTKDIEAERKIHQKMDAVFQKIREEREKYVPDLDKIGQLNEKLAELIKEEAKYVVTNEYEVILKRHGGTGLNAGTYFDKTHYVTNLPSNKLELWAFLESSRFVDPVFREMYKERKVIQEERRVVIENQPLGKLIEELLALAFKNHPYRIRQMGPMNNIDTWTRKDVKSYFHSNYTASNMVIGIAGDITPKQVKKVATKYFSKIKAGRRNPRILTKEPAQIGEKRMTLFEDSQPWLVIGFHCPSVLHKDFITFGVLDYLLTRGRSSRINKKLVIEEKSALFVGSAPGFPASKYPSLYVVFALPNTGHPTEKLEKSVISELEKLKNELVTEGELKSAITRFSIDRIRQMLNYGGFFGLLSVLLDAEMIRGSWKKAFEDLERVESITANDIQELAKKYLTLNNRTILKIEKKKEGK